MTKKKHSKKCPVNVEDTKENDMYACNFVQKKQKILVNWLVTPDIATRMTKQIWEFIITHYYV